MGTVAPIEVVAESFEVAVIVTEPWEGMLMGAVKVVSDPLAVETGLNDPHEDPPQAADHFTPAALGSFDTVTARS